MSIIHSPVSLVKRRAHSVRVSLAEAFRSVRTDGAVCSIAVVRRPDGNNDVYCSGVDPEQAVGMLTRAAYAIDRDARGKE